MGVFLARRRTLLAKGYVCMGDSLTFGYLGTTPYPTVLANATGLSVTNKGFNGRLMTDLETDYVNQNDAALYNAATKDTLIIAAGVNDLNSGSTATAISTAAQSLVTRARGNGFRVFVGTVMPSTTLVGSEETYRLAYNTDVRGGSWHDGFVDFANYPGLTDPTNTTYFNADQLHLTDAGYALMASAVLAVT